MIRFLIGGVLLFASACGTDETAAESESESESEAEAEAEAESEAEAEDECTIIGTGVCEGIDNILECDSCVYENGLCDSERAACADSADCQAYMNCIYPGCEDLCESETKDSEYLRCSLKCWCECQASYPLGFEIQWAITECLNDVCVPMNCSDGPSCD